MKELRVHMDVYLEIPKNQTKESVLNEFEAMLNNISYQIYETEEQEN